MVTWCRKQCVGSGIVFPTRGWTWAPQKAEEWGRATPWERWAPQASCRLDKQVRSVPDTNAVGMWFM